MWRACVGVYQLLNWKMHGETLKSCKQFEFRRLQEKLWKACVKAWLVFCDETTSPWATKVTARTFVFGVLGFQNHQGLTWLPISHHKIYDLVFVQKKQSVLTFTCTFQLTGLFDIFHTVVPSGYYSLILRQNTTN